MKRLTILTLVLVLLNCQVIPAFAIPDNVKYRSTRSFLELLDEVGIVSYNYMGIDSYNQEKVVQTVSLDDGHTINIRFYFTDDNEHCWINVLDLIYYDADNVSEMYRICNELNASYRFCRFYVDESDNSVSVAYDLIFTSSSCDEICYEALMRIYYICNEAINTLANYEL